MNSTKGVLVVGGLNLIFIHYFSCNSSNFKEKNSSPPFLFIKPSNVLKLLEGLVLSQTPMQLLVFTCKTPFRANIPQKTDTKKSCCSVSWSVSACCMEADGIPLISGFDKPVNLELSQHKVRYQLSPGQNGRVLGKEKRNDLISLFY